MNDLVFKGQINIDNMKFNHIEGGFGNGKKSILAKDIANIHDREVKVINQSINMNRQRFKDGIDIFDLRRTEFEVNLIDLGIYTQNAVNRSNNIYLLSERGYAKLLKILEDDFAWDQYEKLVDNYFNMRQIIKEVSKIPSPKVSNQNLIQLEKEKLQKALTTSNYLINYISLANTKVPKDILDSLTTSIQAVHIDIIDNLRNLNNSRR